ncbi:hypothetical protein AXG93_4316s1660 [Marchantia polymorpha subsp. ruderalis]|uniref:Uncharacterized protein n=1 Tax=Marchantia polymorpha subsp. ruderalis TaxID=1480154 RepID=A0A176VTB9_MARPO|nr:hypothetical protein AXG93_4316s1660 [Marchantia polymorpha subsp. ruderalis]
MHQALRDAPLSCVFSPQTLRDRNQQLYLETFQQLPYACNIDLDHPLTGHLVCGDALLHGGAHFHGDDGQNDDDDDSPSSNRLIYERYAFSPVLFAPANLKNLATDSDVWCNDPRVQGVNSCTGSILRVGLDFQSIQNELRSNFGGSSGTEDNVLKSQT